jgi:hypothetical protein
MLGTGAAESDWYYNVHEIDVVGPDGGTVIAASLGGMPYGDSALNSALRFQQSPYTYDSVRDLFAEQQKAQAAAAAQAGAARQTQVQQGPDPNRYPDGSPKTFDASVHDFFHGVDVVFNWLFYITLALVIFFNRNRILRWYYSLTPHPAASVVYDAMNSGSAYNSARLADALNIRPANPIEREVRLDQAADILRTMRDRAESDRVRLQEETDWLKRHADVADMAEVHERIKRRLEAILRAQGKIP